MIRRARLLGLIAAIAVTAAAGGCGRGSSSPNQSSQPSDTSPTPNARALIDLMAKSSFAVLFDAGVQGTTGELLWQRESGVDRWDYVYRTPTGKVGFESSIKSSTIDSACGGLFQDRATVNFRCTPTFDFDEPLNGSIRLLDLKYQSDREIVDMPTHCFTGGVGAVATATPEQWILPAESAVALRPVL